MPKIKNQSIHDFSARLVVATNFSLHAIHHTSNVKQQATPSKMIRKKKKLCIFQSMIKLSYVNVHGFIVRCAEFNLNFCLHTLLSLNWLLRNGLFVRWFSHYHHRTNFFFFGGCVLIECLSNFIQTENSVDVICSTYTRLFLWWLSIFPRT